MTKNNEAGASLILDSRQASAFGESALGGKAANLAWLSRNQFPVPEWFAVTTHAFDLQISQGDVATVIENQLKDKDADDPTLTQAAETIQTAILDTPLHPDIVRALNKQLADEPVETFYAVRSSAVGEDSALASFAGQLDSFLFRKGEKSIADAVLACFASAFNDRAIRYRLRHGMDSVATRAAVVVQRMIDSEISGVAFTAHPITGKRDYALISAAYGSGEGIVSGLCSTDEFTLPLYGDAIEPIINEKDVALYFDTEAGFGLKQTDVEAARQKIPCLSDAQVVALRDIARSIAERLGAPQDIEWAFADGAFHILQTRPVTSLPAPREPRGNRVVWDNSNIQESYCGVTTPLTFSFASTAYAQVYETTLKLTNPSKDEMAELKPSLDNLLGLVKGRVYYNINNWYRGLLLLPSFKSNKADMERMMGLEDPVDFVDPPAASFNEKVRKIPRLVKTLFFLLNSFRRMDKLIDEFFSNFNAVYDGLDRRRFHQMEVGELIQETRNLRTRLLGKWQTPIINDFYVMMMNGRVARTLIATDLENPDVVQNKLMAGEEGIESTEPTKYLLRLCEEIRTRDDLLKTFRDMENEQLMDHLQIHERAIYDRCQEYIERYGDRTMGELKLESITLRQDSSFMFTILKNFLKRDDLKPETLEASEKALRAEAEKEATAAITKRFSKGKLKKFYRDLAKLRDAVRNRENTRLARTRMFGLFRDLYIEIGKQLAFYGVLDDARDIFFLSVDEIEKYDQGRSVQTDLRSLVSGRKAEYEAYEADEPAHHFITNGPVYCHNDYAYPYDQAEPDTDAPHLNGIGCYPGVVETRLKLIFSPEDELDLDGQILCTVRTDPGWAPLFPSAGGILVERGSTLSHSAVVARELGIPAIVNVPGLTKIVSDGETVRMDGATGVVHRLDVKPSEEVIGSHEPGGPD